MNNNIDFTFYSGNDTYEAMTSSSEVMPLLVTDNYDDVLQNGSSPAYLHHLSSNRKSLIDWYPFDENASLLEIGAESGILTSVFCQKLKSVTATDPNKCYCEANALRNKKVDNLSIYAGLSLIHI